MFDHKRNLGCVDDEDCVGGYRTVTEAYVDKLCPKLHPPIDEPETDAERLFNEREMRANAEHRDALRHSSYPCPTCNPDQFLRWTEGDWPNPRRRAKAEGNTAGDPGPIFTGEDVDEPTEFRDVVTR